MPPIIDKNLCIHCGTCVDVCPQDVFFGSKEEEVPFVRYPDECWLCNACVMDCPENAINLRIPLPVLPVYR